LTYFCTDFCQWKIAGKYYFLCLIRTGCFTLLKHLF
jgi:hypothetical protein